MSFPKDGLRRDSDHLVLIFTISVDIERLGFQFPCIVYDDTMIVQHGDRATNRLHDVTTATTICVHVLALLAVVVVIIVVAISSRSSSW